ncbi:MAG: hypothetical protein KGI47_11430 [Betaproteobacteria bacterium]|nr:hypothetical protein [Betaproteobacteria bacterium]MDE2623671.1 hypothetical protein [Betaproteobacteria bacterium]
MISADRKVQMAMPATRGDDASSRWGVVENYLAGTPLQQLFNQKPTRPLKQIAGAECGH